MRAITICAILALSGCDASKNNVADSAERAINSITPEDLAGDWAENGNCGTDKMHFEPNGTWTTEVLGEQYGGRWRLQGNQLIVTGVGGGIEGRHESAEKAAVISNTTRDEFTLSYDDTLERWVRC